MFDPTAAEVEDSDVILGKIVNEKLLDVLEPGARVKTILPEMVPPLIVTSTDVSEKLVIVPSVPLIAMVLVLCVAPNASPEIVIVSPCRPVAGTEVSRG